MTCSCCGEERVRLVALRCHDDVKVCPPCIGWLRSNSGVLDVTPILPVLDMAPSIRFYDTAGFTVREYEPGGGYAFVTYDDESDLDLDLDLVERSLDPAINGAGCYVIVPNVDDWHNRLTSIPSVSNSVATKWRRSWSRMWGSPALTRRRSHRRVASSGRHGRAVPGSLVKTKSSGSTTRPFRTAMSSARRRCDSNASTAWPVIETRRTPPVLVVLTKTPLAGVAETERSIRTVRWEKSTSPHRSAQISPRRAPVAVATESQHAMAGAWTSAAATRRRTVAASGGWMLTRATAGRVASETGLRTSQPHRTACANARCNTTWAQRTREGPRPSAFNAV